MFLIARESHLQLKGLLVHLWKITVNYLRMYTQLRLYYSL